MDAVTHASCFPCPPSFYGVLDRCTGTILCGRRHLPFWVGGRHARVPCVGACACSSWPGRAGRPPGLVLVRLTFPLAVLIHLSVCSAPSGPGLPCMSFPLLSPFRLFFSLVCAPAVAVCLWFPALVVLRLGALWLPPPPSLWLSFPLLCVSAPPVSLAFHSFQPWMQLVMARLVCSPSLTPSDFSCPPTLCPSPLWVVLPLVLCCAVPPCVLSPVSCRGAGGLRACVALCGAPLGSVCVRCGALPPVVLCSALGGVRALCSAAALRRILVVLSGRGRVLCSSLLCCHVPCCGAVVVRLAPGRCALLAVLLWSGLARGSACVLLSFGGVTVRACLLVGCCLASCCVAGVPSCCRVLAFFVLFLCSLFGAVLCCVVVCCVVSCSVALRWPAPWRHPNDMGQGYICSTKKIGIHSAVQVVCDCETSRKFVPDFQRAHTQDTGRG